MTTPLMQYGHAANATDRQTGKSVRAICVGIDNGAERATNMPNLEHRLAKCDYCTTIVPSDTGLAFFEYRPGKQYDRYYCGCEGWQ